MTALWFWDETEQTTLSDLVRAMADMKAAYGSIGRVVWFPPAETITLALLHRAGGQSHEGK